MRRKGGIDNSVSFCYNGVMSELKAKLDTGRVRLRAVTPGVARERLQVATDSGMYNDLDTPRRITVIEEQVRETSGCLKEALLHLRSLNAGASPQAVERAVKGVSERSGNGAWASRRSTPKRECTSGYGSPSEYSGDPDDRRG